MLSQVARNYEQPIFLIVCPATVLEHWLQEMHRWAPFVRTGILHAISSTGKALTALASKGTTFPLILLGEIKRNFRFIESSEDTEER
jgi:SNF2 family DNA or RNA helicase